MYPFGRCWACHIRHNHFSFSGTVMVVFLLYVVVCTIPWTTVDLGVYGLDLNVHNKYGDIVEYMHQLAQQHDFISMGTLGQSYKQQELFYLKFGFPPSDGKTKKIMFVDGGIHPREWISIAVAVNFIHKLSTDRQWRELYRNIDVYVLPVANPDGYDFSFTKDGKDWRKTMSGPRPGGKGKRKQCYGVDLNRNFSFQFGKSDTSKDPCDENYGGPKALSEPESQCLARFLKNNKDFIMTYVSLHAAANLILFPFGYENGKYAENRYELEDLATSASRAIMKAGGEQYHVGAPWEFINYLYPSSGGSDDYAKNLGIRYVFTMELTHINTPFQAPTHIIEPTARTVIEALMVFAKATEKA